MPGENLTRIEAQERRDVIDTQSYEVALDLTKGAEVFGSRSVVRFTATPESFTFMESAVIVAIVVLGGMGSLIGVAIAAVIMIGGTEILLQGVQPSTLSLEDFHFLDSL